MDTSTIIGAFSCFLTIMVICLNFKHREKPSIIIDNYPGGNEKQNCASLSLRNTGEHIVIRKVVSSPEDFVDGLPPTYCDNWRKEEVKTFSLSKSYFPLKQKVRICIIVEDNHNYKFCIYVTYFGARMKIEKIKDYNIFQKVLLSKRKADFKTNKKAH